MRAKVVVLAGLLTVACAGSVRPDDPIVARDSLAFQNASIGLTPNETEKFWSQIQRSTGKWGGADQLAKLEREVAEFGFNESVLLMYGRLNSFLVVAKGALAEGGGQLFYSTTLENGVGRLKQDAEWARSVSALAREVEATQQSCEPNLATRDSSVLYLKVSYPGRGFEVITYGLPPRFPRSATAGLELSPCLRSLMELVRLLEEPVIHRIDELAVERR